MCILLWLLSIALCLCALIATWRIYKQVGYIRRNWPGHLNSFFGQLGDIYKHLGLGLPCEPPRRVMVHRINLALWLWLAALIAVALLWLAC